MIRHTKGFHEFVENYNLRYGHYPFDLEHHVIVEVGGVFALAAFKNGAWRVSLVDEDYELVVIVNLMSSLVNATSNYIFPEDPVFEPQDTIRKIRALPNPKFDPEGEVEAGPMDWRGKDKNEREMITEHVQFHMDNREEFEGENGADTD